MASSVVKEPAREVSVVADVDVLVVGAGFAGLGASIAAARNGAKVGLVERIGFLGGCVTADMMDVLWMSRAGDRKAVEGIYMETLRRLKEMGGLDGEPGYRCYADSERLKILADQMVAEAGIDLWMHTLGVLPVMEGQRVSGAIIESKSGRQAIKAKVVVDASGDGDIAARAGAEWKMGREADGMVQPVSTSFKLTNVSMEEVRGYYRENPHDIWFSKLIQQARAAGDYKVPRDSITLHGIRPWGELTGINATRVVIKDPTNVKMLTWAEQEARRQVYQVRDFLRKYAPGFQHCEVSYIATQIAARESRRFTGAYVLTLDDVVKGSRFPDCVAVSPCFTDFHNPRGHDTLLYYPKPATPDENVLWMGRRSSADGKSSEFERQTYPAGPSSELPPTITVAEAATYDIPYRALVPLQIDGILTSGRCISATSEAEASIRYLPISFATGQAAGTAAALAALGNRQPRDLDVAALQGKLAAQGAFLGEGVAVS